MKVSVIGCGYLGTVHAAALAQLGHEVVGVELDQAKVESLTAGEAPFYEPGLADLLLSAGRTGRLRFTTDAAQVAGSRVHLVTVGTPPRGPNHTADLAQVDAAIEAILPWLRPGDVVVGKSTVPVGTAARLADRLAVESPEARLVWSPEFLREGFAVEDAVQPDRIVYGLPADPAAAAEARAVLDELNAAALAAGTPLVVTNYQTAELVKLAANAFLAMAEIAEVVDADVTQLADAIGFDPRIGRRFLDAGVGFGGGCLPKDLRAFQASAEELGTARSVDFLREVDVELVLETLGGRPFGKRVAVLGLAFKPNSDDVRDSPALDVAVQLKGLGVDVVATDPQAIGNSRRLHPQLSFTADVDEALTGAEAVVVVTEWAQFRELDPVRVRRLVARPVMVDARNCLDREAWQAAGWTYLGMGRGVVPSSPAR